MQPGISPQSVLMSINEPVAQLGGDIAQSAAIRHFPRLISISLGGPDRAPPPGNDSAGRPFCCCAILHSKLL